MRWTFLLVAALAGCASVKDIGEFAGTKPTFDPVQFFTGHVTSWGVVERSGQPTDVVVTDCVGEPEGAGLHLTQKLTVGADVSHREWHVTRTAQDHYAATANDMVGTAQGVSSGRAFHWSWVLATKPGHSLFDVTMDQWWYLLDDGTMMNRTTVSKLGITIAQVSEHFAPVR